MTLTWDVVFHKVSRQWADVSDFFKCPCMKPHIAMPITTVFAQKKEKGKIPDHKLCGVLFAYSPENLKQKNQKQNIIVLIVLFTLE